MVQIKDWKKYYTLEEASNLLDERVKERAKNVSKDLLLKVNNK